jgi:hypothetical protein
MPESESSKSEGMLAKIIVGVATPVFTALALYYFGIGGSGEKKAAPSASAPPQVQGVQPVNDSDLRARQAELERQIKEISQKQKETVQTGIAAIEARRDEAQRAAPSPEPDAPNITGFWYDQATGSAYNFQADGDLVTIQEYTLQVITAYGQGTLRGRRVDFEFYSVSLGIRGRGSLEISPEGDRIALTVVNPINGQRVTSDLQRTN